MSLYCHIIIVIMLNINNGQTIITTTSDVNHIRFFTDDKYMDIFNIYVCDF